MRNMAVGSKRVAMVRLMFWLTSRNSQGTIRVSMPLTAANTGARLF